MIFGAKKIDVNRVEDNSRQDLALITQMNQELAGSLDLKETLQNALEVIIKRINAQAANIFLIEEKKQVFQCIASKYQAYLEDFEIPLTQESIPEIINPFANLPEPDLGPVGQLPPVVTGADPAVMTANQRLIPGDFNSLTQAQKYEILFGGN